MQDSHALTIKKIVQALTAERKRLGLSQETLAVAAKVSDSCIRHLEHERSTPTLLTLLKLSDALALDLPDLVRKAQRQ